MRILLTGGRGYLGHALIGDLDAAGHDLTLISRTDQPIRGHHPIRVDLRDGPALRHALKGQWFDAVCHLAALTNARDSVEHPLAYWEANVSATINLLTAINPDAAVVLASTASVYGGDAAGALDEDTPIQPSHPYAASKYASEQVIQARTHAVEGGSTVLRCFNIAGAVNGVGDPDSSRALPAMLNAVIGKSPAFTINGDGSVIRDYTHVADVAAAFRLAIEARNGSDHTVYNVGTGNGLSIAELNAALQHVVGREVPTRRSSPKNEPHRLVADNRKITDQLGWQPKQSDPYTLVHDAWHALGTTAVQHDPTSIADSGSI